MYKIRDFVGIGAIVLVVSSCGGSDSEEHPGFIPANTEAQIVSGPYLVDPSDSSFVLPNNTNDESTGGGTNSDDPLTGTPEGGYLDCENLDTNKVYLHGALGTDTNSRAIGDPLNPTLICVASPARYGTISSNGRYLHQITAYSAPERITSNVLGEAVAEFSQEDLWVDDEGNWDYYIAGDNHVYNDNVLAIVNENALAVTDIIASPNDTSEFVYLYFDDIYNPDGTLIYTISFGSPSALAMLDNGSVLVGENDGLYAISMLGDVTQISDTEDSETNWRLAGKHHSGGIWLITASTGGIERWTLDNEMMITSDGFYAARPEELVDSVFPESYAIDGEGNLWELHYESNNLSVILRRPLEGAGESEIVYRGENAPTTDWTQNSTLYIRPYLDSSLITGP